MISRLKDYKQALIGLICLILAGFLLIHSYFQAKHTKLEGIWTEKVEEKASRLIIQGNQVIIEAQHPTDLGHFITNQFYETNPYSDRFSYVRQSNYLENNYTSELTEEEVAAYYQKYRDLVKVNYLFAGENLVISYDYSQSNKHFKKLWEEASNLNELAFFFGFLHFDANNQIIDKQTIKYEKGQ